MTQTAKSEFFEGVRDCLPIMFAVSFFGMLFGATAVNNGLSFWQTMGSSASVFAGASQFVFLDLYKVSDILNHNMQKHSNCSNC